MNDYPIQLGSMLFTMVDPTKGNEVAYNRWYERDHFYAGCMVGPWLFAGGRWVAPKALKDLRFPADNPIVTDPEGGSFLSIYWVLEDKHEAHFDWALEQVVWLYAQDRGFNERVHNHTALYDHPSAHYRDADPVPIELALDHRYDGMVACFIERADGADEDALQALLRDRAVPALLDGSDIASCAQFKPINRDANDAGAPMDLGSSPGDQERTMQLFFLDAKPEASMDRFHAYADAIEASGLGKLLCCAPYYPTNVGTDDYTDQLW